MGIKKCRLFVCLFGGKSSLRINQLHNNHHGMGKIAAKYPYLVLLCETLNALLRNQNKMLLSDATRVPIHFIQRLNRLNDEGLHENWVDTHEWKKKRRIEKHPPLQMTTMNANICFTSSIASFQTFWHNCAMFSSSSHMLLLWAVCSFVRSFARLFVRSLILYFKQCCDTIYLHKNFLNSFEYTKRT